MVITLLYLLQEEKHVLTWYCAMLLYCCTVCGDDYSVTNQSIIPLSLCVKSYRVDWHYRNQLNFLYHGSSEEEEKRTQFIMASWSSTMKGIRVQHYPTFST